VNYDEIDNEFISTFGIYDDIGLPLIFVTHLDGRVGQLDKYLYEKDEIESELIHDFIEEVRRKEVNIYYKSEEVPDYS